MKFPLLISITLLLASCSTSTVNTSTPTPRVNTSTPTPSIEKIQRVPYNPEEFARYLVKGTAEVTGQAFMKTQSGEVKYAAGNIIMLNPVTSMSNQWYKEFYVLPLHLHNNKEFINNDPEGFKKYQEAVIETQANGEGRFKFQNVPAGNYYLTTSIIWQVPGRYGLTSTGGIVCRKVSIRSGESHNFILTR